MRGAVKIKICDELLDLASEESDLVSLESMQCGEPLRLKFDDYQQNVRDGYLGKTVQFWLIYIETMRNQLQYHTSVQENDFQLRLLSIESFIPLYFYYNMHNYARYASYYVQVLKCIDKNYPGLKEMLTSTDISVQSQDRYPLRTAIDMRGEQTLNKDAKTSGGVTQFASSASSVQKWAMNRSDAAETRKALCFKLLDTSSRFKEAFSQLGSSWELSDDTFNVLQSFVVRLYGIRKNINVNEARYKIFSRKLENEEKTIDMSVLPPCESVLRLHCERANYLAAIWKNATTSQPEFPDTVHHGWNTDKSITWVVAIFPDEVESILLDNRYDPDDVNDAHGESDDDELTEE